MSFLRSPIHVASLSTPVAAGGGGGFSDTPSNYAGLIGWWKADSLSANDGDLIASWADSSGNSNTATAAGTARPTYKASIYNGQPTLRFNGTTNIMSLTSSIKATSGVSAWAAMCVIKLFNTNVTGTCFDGSVSGDEMTRQSFAGVNNRMYLRILEMQSGPRTSNQFLVYGQTDLSMIVAKIAAGAGGPTFYEGKTARGVQGSFEDTPVWNRIGGPQNPTNMDICEMLFWDGLITDANLTSLYDNYFVPKWGLATM